MNRPGRVSRRLAIAGAIAACLAPCLGTSAHATPPPAYPLLPHELFDTPIRANGYFGDHRSNHFHAGLDLNTGGKVGRAVHAPADGEMVRLRASGVGYGRSLYLQMTDGRLLVFGHLDAFAEPFASYIEGVQDSSGQYEQDLWPAAGRFHVHAGDCVGWTGRSGTGGPHLHVEIRRGDMAINPLLAGYALPDTTTPRIERVTLAPLDDTSAVWGGPIAAGYAFGSRDSMVATGWGRLRVIVEAVDAESDGTYDVSPWRLRMTNGTEWVECEFDSASWATDMAQSDFEYDRGRYTAHGRQSLVMGAPAGFRPRVMATSANLDRDAGVVMLDDAHHEALLVIEAEDLAGHIDRRYVRLTAARAHAPRPKVTVKWRQARAMTPAASSAIELPGLGGIRVPEQALFEPATLQLAPHARTRQPAELIAVGADRDSELLVFPATTPLRAAAEISMALARAVAPKGVGVYHADGADWEWIGDRYDAAKHVVSGSTRHLGTFALFRDTQAPRIRLFAPPKHAAAAAYQTWALEAPLAEQGSGVDARATYFVVDGHRCPSEWDSVIGVLRWKPLHVPASGKHAVTVVAADHAGNVRKTGGAFVVD